MNAPVDRSRPPAPGRSPKVAMATYTGFDLPNGTHVVVVPDHKLPIVGVQVRFDLPPLAFGDKAGIADLTGELLLAGTTARSKARIDEEVDRLGAMLHSTNEGVHASVLKKRLSALVGVLADVVKDPVFPEAEFHAALTRQRSGARQRKDDPDAIAEVVGRAVVFGHAHPFGEVATEASLAAVQAGHVRTFHARWFRPEKAILVFVGDITGEEARALAEEHFGDWGPRQVRTTMGAHGAEEVEGLGTVSTLAGPVVPSGARRVHVVDRPGATQSVARVAFPLDLHPRHPGVLEAQVMNTILGGGVFNARLMQNLREDKGWTYGVYSSLDVDRFNSSFSAAVSVRTGVTDGAVEEIVREMERMRGEPVGADELDLARSYMAGGFARSLEDPRTVARFAVNTRLNGLPEDHYATYLERLGAVTTEGVQRAAREFLHPDQAAVVVVGDRRAVERGLAALALDRETPVVGLDENGTPG